MTSLSKKIVKEELRAYYQTVAPFLLPHLKDRPQTLLLHPKGIGTKGALQKHLKEHPEWVATVEIEERGKMIKHLVIQDVMTLLHAIDLGCIEIHPWLSRYQEIDRPDFLVFALRAEQIDFDAVIEVALSLHTLLERQGIENFCKTAGEKGLHIVADVGGKYAYDEAKQMARLFALALHHLLPRLVSLQKGEKRRVHIDCMHNDFGKTVVAPYAVLALPGGPVSTPLEWREVKKGLQPTDYTLFTLPKRLHKKGDLFESLLH